MTPRLDQLTGPVEVGKFYVVPTVRGEWNDQVRDWPVIGPSHNDSHCLDFHDIHFHFDARFMPGPEDDESYWRYAFAAPLMLNEHGKKNEGLPDPVWKRRRCRRLANPFLVEMQRLAAKYPTWDCHFKYWEGKQAKRDARGWICPHRNVSLADQAPDSGRVIFCPLHLLPIDADTGKVLPAMFAVSA